MSLDVGSGSGLGSGHLLGLLLLLLLLARVLALLLLGQLDRRHLVDYNMPVFDRERAGA